MMAEKLSRRANRHLSDFENLPCTVPPQHHFPGRARTLPLNFGTELAVTGSMRVRHGARGALRRGIEIRTETGVKRLALLLLHPQPPPTHPPPSPPHPPILHPSLYCWHAMTKFDETTLRELTWDNLKTVAKVSVGRGMWLSVVVADAVPAGEQRACRAEAREDHRGAFDD